MTQTYHEALQPIVAEFKNICPDITNAYVFDKEGKTVATSEKASKEQNQNAIAELNKITQAQCIGGIENLTIQGTHRQLSITAMNKLYLATVTSKTADQKVIKALSQTIVPTVVNLVDELSEPCAEDQLLKKPKLENRETAKPVLSIEKPKTVKPLAKPQATSTLTSKNSPKASVHQLMVEKIGGLFVPSDIVRIDDEIISKWSQHCEGKAITMVTVETFEGKTTTCKLKEIKNANGKGIIQVPEKILQALQASNGKLVKVKPVVDSEGD